MPDLTEEQIKTAYDQYFQQCLAETPEFNDVCRILSTGPLRGLQRILYAFFRAGVQTGLKVDNRQ